MLLLIVLVFSGVFVVLTMVLVASGGGASQRNKQVLVNLSSALGMSPTSREPMVDVRKDELFSAIPWINRWLLKIEVAPRLRNILYQSNLKWTTGGLLLMSAACFVIPGYLVYLRTGAVIFSLLIAALTGFAPFFFVLHKRAKRFRSFEQGLPEALDLMVSALRAGHSLTAAMGLIAKESPDPIGTEFRICFEEENYGLELRTAIENMITRVPLQDLRLVATAILIQKESGGNLAEVLDKVAYVIRERFRLRRQVAIHSAQGRLTGWILSFLPVVLGIGLYLVNPDTISLLWKREIGVKLLYTAAVMTLCGALIIRKIVRMDV